ncbi:MAG: hypothetical protein WD072_01920 [Pirellulales bacterium]
MQTLALLWDTCGVTGLLSAVASIAAAALLAIGIVPGGRFRVWLTAAIFAAAATVLAIVTSWNVRAIEIDRSAEVLAAEATGVKAAQEKLRSRAANIRFAEDTAVDQADVAGVTAAEEEGAYSRAVAAELEKIPAYRRAGRKDRSLTKRADEAAADDTGPEASGTEGQADAETVETLVRRLPEAELQVADRFDRINRGFAWSLLSFAVGLVGWEWVRRFNTTFDAVWPLPLAGTVVDGAAPKAHVVVPDETVQLADFLSATARKGESFIVFTKPGLLAECDRLDRVAAGSLRWSLPVRSLTAAEIAADPALAELVFETAWFGRAGFVIRGEHEAERVLADWANRLERRRHCRASARCTLNLVWAMPTAPDAAVAGRITGIATPTNIRWIDCTAADMSTGP